MEENSIIFFGSAGDVSSVNKQLRASGGFLLKYNNSQFHVDPGPGSLVQYKLNKISPRSTISLIVTNNELSHCGDTNAVISAMTHDGLDNRGVLIASESIIEGTDVENPVLWKRYKSYLERNIIIRSGERVGINDVEIYGIPAKSKDKTGVGLKIVNNNFTLVYTSDTKFHNSLIANYESADILVIKVPYMDSSESDEGVNIENVKKIITDTIPRVAILTGFGSKIIYSDPIVLARDIQRETGVQTIAAYDGLKLNPDLYGKRQ